MKFLKSKMIEMIFTLRAMVILKLAFFEGPPWQMEFPGQG